jgi:hypothetical protein
MTRELNMTKQKWNLKNAVKGCSMLMASAFILPFYATPSSAGTCYTPINTAIGGAYAGDYGFDTAGSLVAQTFNYIAINASGIDFCNQSPAEILSDEIIEGAWSACIMNAGTSWEKGVLTKYGSYDIDDEMYPFRRSNEGYSRRLGDRQARRNAVDALGRRVGNFYFVQRSDDPSRILRDEKITQFLENCGLTGITNDLNDLWNDVYPGVPFPAG